MHFCSIILLFTFLSLLVAEPEDEKLQRYSYADQCPPIDKCLANQIEEINAQVTLLEYEFERLEAWWVRKLGAQNQPPLFKGVSTLVASSPYSNKYFIFPRYAATFWEAKSFCEDRGTTLASIHSQGEYDFVEQWLSTHYKVYSHVWLGHHRQDYNSSQWHDESPIVYTFWGPVDNKGNPNPSGCMFMCHYCGEKNGWYIRPCSQKASFLCQKYYE